MPIGIQMFATISSKNHFQTLQQDLSNIAGDPSYHDTTVYCSDGQLQYCRLILGLIFPELETVSSFSWLPEISVLAPQYLRCEVESRVRRLLSGSETVMGELSESIDSIIDNLRPETQTRGRATLLSEETRETVVLHAAGETDELEDVLVVNEEQSSADDTDQVTRYSNRHSALTGHVTRGNTGLRSPDHGHPRHTAPVTNKPPTYVPIPSKKDKTKISRSSLASPASTVITPDHKHIKHSPLQPQHSSVRSTRVSTVSRVEQSVSVNRQLLPRTTEIRPVERSAPPAPRLRFPCPVCHQEFLAQDVMETHLKIHSNKHKCQTCGVVFIKARELIEHQRIHSGARLVKCNICDKDFTEKGLRLHSERFHKILENKSPQLRRSLKDNQEDSITFTSSSDDSSDDDDVDDPDAGSSEEEDMDNPKPVRTGSQKSSSQAARSEICDLCDKYFTKKGRFPEYVEI